jgi:hypothetical protein
LSTPAYFENEDKGGFTPGIETQWRKGWATLQATLDWTSSSGYGDFIRRQNVCLKTEELVTC